jgi:cyclic beta-1,2-glucan synthetase
MRVHSLDLCRSTLKQLVLAFYPEDQVNGREVLRALRSRQIYRSATLSRSQFGKLQVLRNGFSPLQWILCGIFLSGIVLLLPYLPIGLVFSSLAGLLILGLLLRRGGRPDRQTVARYSRSVLENEILVLIQTPHRDLSHIISLLRSIGDSQPAIFTVRDGSQQKTSKTDRPRREPLGAESLRQHAAELASVHRLATGTHSRQRLLRKLRESTEVLETARHDLSEAAELEQRITPSAEWLLDNAYVIQGHILDIRRNLPRKYEKDLPALVRAPAPQQLRIQVLAEELIKHTDARLTPSNIADFLTAYQTVSPLTIGELWAFPILLRFVLVEELKERAIQVNRRQYDRELADFWANRLLNAARRDPNRLLSVLADLAREQSNAAPHFAVRLIGHLYDEEAALAPVQRWLERQHQASPQEIIRQEQARQAAYQVSIANAIGSLRQLAQMDWRDTFEAVSVVESTLRQDPAGVYADSDFATRDRCRRRVEKLSLYSKKSELQVAQQAIEMAHRASGTDHKQQCHVGYFLLAQGQASLEGELRCRLPVLVRIHRWVERHAVFLFLEGVGLLTGAFVILAWLLTRATSNSFWPSLLVACIAVLPASELSVQLIQMLVSRTFRPRVLPKLSFRNGIPEEYRTLVAVPMMLLTQESVQQEVEKLEIRYLANPDPNLCFALVSDFTDTPKSQMPEDLDLLDIAIRGIEQLNQKYKPGRFFLFHRSRRFSRTQQCWMGWERKRGKIEELNAYLNGQGPPDFLLVGDPSNLGQISFVITLDTDTQLPHDAARRLVETIAHPLNRPRLSSEHRLVAQGYTIIQPRVSITLPSATATPFTRLFSDSNGSDPYSSAVSDFYQDLFGEGIFHGKGIFDSKVFHQVLAGRFPEETLLSHDLIEGAYVRVGYASDIELFEQFPVNYQSYMKRQHRWIRGDWQIASWTLPSVPGSAGVRVPNPLSLINRWKILDNLRRSLVPVASVSLLLANWLLLPRALVWSVMVGLMLTAPLLESLASMLVERFRGTRGLWSLQLRTFFKILVTTALLPHQALFAMDAIVRVIYRCLFSRRQLLEWESAQVAHWQAKSGLSRFVTHMLFVTLGTGILTIILHRRDFVAWAAAAPFLMLWLLSPAIANWMNGHKRTRRRPRLFPDDRRFLRQVACQTWRYFDDFVGPQTHWLPPDNSQESLRIEVAQRTSPTNIGLWLLSALAAYDLGFLSRDQMVERVALTLASLEKLERWEGHLLNWYDIRSLEPLRPPYVSTVDSGNFLAALWVLENGCRDSLNLPIIGPAAFRGVSDKLDLLCGVLEREDLKSGTVKEALARLAHAIKNAPDDLEQLVRRMRQAVDPAKRLAHSIRATLPAGDERVYWATRIEEAVLAWIGVIDRYLHWFELLLDLPDDPTQAPLGGDWRENLKHAPSLEKLADSQQPILSDLFLNELPVASRTIRLENVKEAFYHAQQRARQAIQSTTDCLARLRTLGDGINFRFLYDPARRLFATGYNAGAHSRDRSYYDLLASEARLASLIAIARGDVPAEHWLTLGRPYGSVEGRSVLLSWGGTMFEYLMPLLFTRTFENSLLDYAVRAAVGRQREYAQHRGIPWGISEAAFSALDADRTYQYRAFGVPGLGLRRGLEEDLVVSPYSSFLALAVEPVAALRNLRHMARSGLRGAKGFYESIDYTRQQREGERGVIVYAYMAHHQGMSLIAINNLLNDQIVQNRFHADPRVRSTESLFFEKIPTTSSAYFSPAPDRPIPRSIEALPTPSVVRVNTANTAIPRTHLLSNGSYTVMITNAGGGYSRWKDFDLTRWRADTTRDVWGTFCYVRDLKSGSAWSTAFHPLDRPERRYSATFASDRVQFCRRDARIETLTELVISPEDDAEIRRITLTNTSSRARYLELTSYAELVLSPHSADRSHPAFGKLFVETEALHDRRALLAWRRPRSPEEPSIYAGEIIAAPMPFEGSWEYETERAAFLGRGRSLQNPVALERPLSSKSGLVLDPIFSLRRRVILAPGQKAVVAFVMVAAETRERVLMLLDKYRELQSANRAIDLSWTHAQLELRYLGLQADEAQVFQNLAAHMHYPNFQLRPPAERLRRNALGQSRLWAFGISGDLPILAVVVSDLQDLALVREALLAHTYWRVRGLKADLVILNKEVGGYEQPLHTGVDRPGGVFLRCIDQIPDEEVTLLLAAARAVLVAARGSLAQQLSRAAEPVELPLPLEVSDTFDEISRRPSPPFPLLELSCFNGLGGFSPDGREYVIYLKPGEQTPAPWINVMANPAFGALISESGGGFLWYGNSQSNRQTPWVNDPLSVASSEGIYVRDEESGLFWSPTADPCPDPDDGYRIRHSQGYSVFEHHSHAIHQELVSFVPMNPAGGETLRLQRLRLRNTSNRARRLSVTTYAEWTLGADREETQQHIVTSWDERSQALLARNLYHPEFSQRIAFAFLCPRVGSFTGDRTEFLGRNGSPGRPAALQRQQLSGCTGAGLDPCAALQVQLELEPGGTVDVSYLLGQTSDLDQVRALSQRFRDPREVETSLAETKKWWDQFLGTIEVNTPDPATNFLINRWLLYQTLSCRIWARSAFFQSSGAFGFRDQLQDTMALVYAAPALTREHLLRTASRQFVEGDVQHWWHPQSGAGIRTRCSDDLLWLPYSAAHYWRITGDETIFSERVPFLEGRALEPHETEVYLIPTPAMTDGTLFEHCWRAIQKAVTQGPHGLPLIGSGDWNDGMNRVGPQGQGESVWLAWFIIDVLNSFLPICESRGDRAALDFCHTHVQRLKEAVETHGWDGKWYRRGYFDDGTPLGSESNPEAIIDSLPQSWAVISGMADPARSQEALKSVERMLIREKEKLVLLLTPPFERSSPHPGYIAGYPAGVRENGGQYTHAAIWVAMAFARLRDGKKAADVLRLLNPVEHTRTPEEVARYKGEPYAVAADVYSLKGQEGRCGWTWYTGSSGWMYRVWLEEILGFRLRGDTVSVAPVIPSEWKSFSLRYRYRDTWYDIQVEDPDGAGHGVAWIKVDGRQATSDCFTLHDDKTEHKVVVRLAGSKGSFKDGAVESSDSREAKQPLGT